MISGEGDDDDIHVDAIRPRNLDSRGGGSSGEGLIKLRQFATVPHLPPNVQSRGSTPSTTPAPSGSSSSAGAAAAATNAVRKHNDTSF